MNAALNIVVRVDATQANAAWRQQKQQIGGLSGGLSQLNKALDPQRLVAWGKNLQWTGRQITYAFTLPLAAAGIAAFKFSQDNERAFISLKKVYGDFSYTQSRVNSETNALRKSFELLSDRFGVSQKDVIEIGAAFAQAGAAGRALADDTRYALETMILGEMDATQATTALVSIMGAWDLSAKKNKQGFSELGDALATINAIENQTSITFSDLMTVLQKAGGAARDAGIDIRHLSAFAATLVPAAGSAAQAGNALRTIISRLQAPTKDTSDLLAKMGIDVLSKDWLGSSVQDRILKVAQKFQTLSQSQKGVVSSVIASRWQVNRFDILMRKIADTTGNYNRALDATSNTTKIHALYQRELLQVLNSEPKKWDIMTQTIKNGLTTAILPLIPAIFGVLKMFTNWALAFSKMAPERQRFIIGLAAVLAALGPIMIYLGVTVQLIGELGRVAKFTGRVLGGLGQGFLNLGKAIIWSYRQLGQAILTFAQWVFYHISGQAAVAKAAQASAKAQAEAAAQAAAAQTAAAAEAAGAQAEAAGAAADAWASGAYASEAAWATAMGLNVSTVEAGAAVIETTATEMFGELTAGAITTEAAVTAPLWGIVAVVAAVVAAVAILWKVGFYDFMIRLWGNVLRGFNSLIKGFFNGLDALGRAVWGIPKAFVSALRATIQVVDKAVHVVYEMLSYLNPFARHSPSLVDNVKAGVATILNEYSKLRGIPNLVLNATRVQQNFNNATSGARGALATQDRVDQRKQITDYAPTAGPAVDSMYQSIDALKGTLGLLTIEIAKQETVVARWQAAYDAADKKVQAIQATIDSLQFSLDGLDKIIQTAHDNIDALANTDIQGMRALSDQIFANDQAQKQLQLQIMKLQDAGGAVDDLAGKFSKLQGEIEMVQGKEQDLRLGGAGSEILGFYDNQLKSLKQQQGALQGQSSEIDQLTAKLNNLQRVGQELDLSNSITFDPQIRQIQQMVSGLHEMPFDQIIAQIQQQQAIISQTQPKYDAIKKSLDSQNESLRQATYYRDQINARLDIENKKADDLNQAYSDIDSQINDMESSLSGFAQSASAALDKAKKDSQSLNQKLFDAGAGANYDIPGGTGGLGAYGNTKDIQDFNKDLQKELDKVLGGIQGIDLFKPIKDKWNAAWAWIKRSTAAVTRPIVDFVKKYFAQPIADTAGWIGRNFSLEGLKNVWNSTINFMSGVWQAFAGAISSGYHTYIQPVFDAIGNAVMAVLVPIFETLAAVFSWLWNNIIGPVVSFVWNTILKPVFDAIANFIEKRLFPIFQLWAALWTIVIVVIGRMARWLWDHVLKLVFAFIMDGIRKLKTTFQLLAIAIGFVFVIIRNAISFAWNYVIKPIFAAIKWAIEHVVGPAFRWLYNNVIDPVWHNIQKLIHNVWNDVLKPIFDSISWWIHTVVGPAFHWLHDKVVSPVMNAIKSVVKSVWNSIATTIAGGINLFVKAFNFVAKGVRAVAGVLHIDVKINDIGEVKIPKFARGGAIQASEVGAGFKTNGPRAIVGEGSPLHPEYVIPTDPRYRNRARKLLVDAAGSVFGGPDTAIPAYAFGGILPSPADVINGIKGVVDTLKKGALKLAFSGPSKLADEAIKHIPFPPIRASAQKIKDQVYNWVTEGDKNVDKIIQEYSTKNLGPYGRYPGKENVMGWINQAIDILGDAAGGYPKQVWAPRDFVIAMRESGGNPRAVNLWDSNAKAGHPSEGLMQTIQSTFNAYKIKGHDDIWNPVDNVIAANRYIKARYGDITAVQQGNPAQPPRGYELGGVIDAHMARGGLVLNRKPGGVLLHVAEGSNDEAVQVRPLNDKTDGKGNRELHFHGDLVFPSVSNEKDAESFIRSLESLGT
jgi:TP901 family phage tail tape measure protein